MINDAPTPGELLKQLAEADNEVATARGVLKAKQEAYDGVESQIFRLMDELGTETFRNKEVGLQVSISETTMDIIEDFDKLAPFVRRRNLLHFFHRRLSSKAIAEFRETHKTAIPGLGTFKKRRLSVTTIS